MRFEWDEEKNRQNLRKHDVRFETAVLAFDDPYALTQRDALSVHEERWITLGAVGSAVLFVVHAWFERDNEEMIRIISARQATPRERHIYEEANEGTEARHRSSRRQERRRH